MAYGEKRLIARLDPSADSRGPVSLEDFILGAYPAQVFDVVEAAYRVLGEPSNSQLEAQINDAFADETCDWRLADGAFKPQGADVSVEASLHAHRASHEFIAEQIGKCDRKLQDGDYDGAITNARSLLEAVLSDLEARLSPAAVEYDGDLPKLYRRVQKLLNLDPGQKDLTEALKQILSGLINVVSGVAALRNRVSDAHVRLYKPERHHAKLAINASKTAADFFFETFEYQKRAGRIQEISGQPGA